MDSAKCGTITSLMEDIAPKKLAEDWDNVGLIIGDGSHIVKKIMVCLDLPLWVLDEALENDIDMIVTHHPFIFDRIKKINTDTTLGKKIIKLIRKGVDVYSSHTNFDLAKDGLNDTFARQLGFNDFSIIQPLNEEKLFKIVIYVPEGAEGKILESLSKAGAGYIGNYSNCSFRSKGIGTFKPEEGSNPYIGKKGIIEEVNEYKLETIVPENSLKRVLKEIKKVHPYEEPAYDILELKNEGNMLGIGRLGEPKNSTTLVSYAEFVKKALDLNSIRYAGKPDSLIKKVALVNGSGNNFVSQAKYAGADVLVTGDMQYHQIVEALEDGISIIDAGHFGTEKIMVKVVADYLNSKLHKLGYGVEVIESRSNIDPIMSF